MKIDVVVRTYNSGKYLDACLKGIREAFNVNRLIVIDHHSTDETISIAKKYDATIYYESQGIGYALGLGISKAETSIFAVIDSDVVLVKGKWVDSLYRKFDNPRIGGVGLRMFSDEPLWRKEYCAYYFRVKDFEGIKSGEWVNAYIIRKKALGRHFHIPDYLRSYEHVYLKDSIIRNGYEIDFVDADGGTHYYDFSGNDGFYLGAGDRLYNGLSNLLRTIFRQALLSPLKSVLPAIAYSDANVILGNTKYWFDYLKGYLDPEEYLGDMVRSHDNQ
jgi:glycosyltransferase involved in cell wall biosynthesis